jgi:hypothetical protein
VVRHVALVIAAGLLASCAALAGIDDGPSASDATADGGTLPSRLDAAQPGVDATAAADAAPAGPPVASISLVCNGIAATKNTCPNKRWEYDLDACLRATTRTVILQNTGAFPVAYIVRRSWSLLTYYVPSQPTDGQSGELTGVLGAGEQRDITTAVDGGIVLVVGSVHPFDAAALTAPLRDEGRLAYAPTMLGSFPTNGQLFAAQVSAPTPTIARCADHTIVFKKL